MSSWTTKTLNISPPQKYFPADKPSGLSFYLNLILLSTSTLGNSEKSLMPLLDNGMSTPKRGIVAMPVLTLIISGQCLPMNSSLIHSVLLTLSLWSYMQSLSWMWKHSMMTSYPHSLLIQLLKSTSLTLWTLAGQQMNLASYA